MYQQAAQQNPGAQSAGPQPGPQQGPAANASSAKADDNVVDAEVEDVDDKKR